MSNTKYVYNLLSNSKIYTSLFNNYSYVLDTLVLQYLVYDFDFLKEASFRLKDSSDSENLSLLPLAVRYVSPDNSLYVIERPPFQIDVDFSNNKSYDYRQSPKYLKDNTMWIPWTICVISKGSRNASFGGNYSFNIYFNDGPISSFEDILIPCFLPNSSNGSICMGADSALASNMIKDNAPIVEVYNHLFNSYFAGWNCDIHNNLPFHEYFKDNKIIERLIGSKKGPKNYEALRYSRSVSKSYNQMLYLLSELDLTETLDYISYSKKQTLERYGPNYSKSLQNIIDSYSSKGNLSYEYGYNRNPSYLIDSLCSDFSSQSFDNVKAVVQVSDAKQYSVNHFYNNPYLTAKIYQNYQSLKDEDYFANNNSFSLNLTSEELLPYSSFQDQEDSNAIPS